jgi:hypothetical protein
MNQIIRNQKLDAKDRKAQMDHEKRMEKRRMLQ